MSQPFPTGGFQWEKECERLAQSIPEHLAESPEGFILEVDLKYSLELHEAHNAYPLAPRPTTQRDEQESAGENEGRVCRVSSC